MNHLISHPRRAARGFSLLEILLATLILGIGLIMIASIFPVGADWTRQAAQETIAQNVAWNAVALVKARYVGTGLFTPSAPPSDTNDAYYQNGQWMANGAAVTTGTRRVYCLPTFGNTIPLSERSYAIGTDQPFPVPQNRWPDAQYCWTALIRVPDDNSSTVTLYILVFHRGSRDQTFTATGTTSVRFADGSNSGTLNELTDARSTANDKNAAGSVIAPSLWYGTYANGKTANNKVGEDIIDCWPPLGNFGIGLNSGTVFRQVIDTNPSSSKAYRQAVPNPTLSTNGSLEQVITAIPPDNWADSSLVYIYQTQLSF